MKTPQEDLLIQITNCKYLEGKTKCSSIVKSQPCIPPHTPEPWSGDLKNAKVIFIGSNPSFNCDEYYPTKEWCTNQKIDFFTNRFTNYATNEIYPKMKNEAVGKRNWVRFWAGVRARTKELAELPSLKPLNFGKDIVITEIVHCKSRKESGVKKAARICVDEYFDNIMKLSNAKLIVVMGKIAEKYLKDKIQGGDSNSFYSIKYEKIFVFQPHPNARMKRSFDKETLREIDMLIKSSDR